MTLPKIDDHLLDWNEIKDLGWNEIFLGNGFSINIWERFAYPSLYSIACSEDIDLPLSKESKDIFVRLDTINFEYSLQVLSSALLIDQIIKGGQEAKLKTLYENIQNALANSINYSHIPPNTCDLNYLNDELSNYRSIFTTNYDLIPYWAIMQKETWKFKDYFWGPNNSFDPFDTSIPADRTRIIYIHGALHLFEDKSNKAFKLTADGINRLLDLFNLYENDRFPLFITEGVSKSKYDKIYSSPYLRFAYEELINSDSSIVILGHSLDETYDAHLLKAIKQSDRENICISVFNPDNRKRSIEIIEFKARLLEKLSSKNLYFFESRTHPLGIERLKCIHDNG